MYKAQYNISRKEKGYSIKRTTPYITRDTYLISLYKATTPHSLLLQTSLSFLYLAFLNLPCLISSINASF